MTYSTAEQLGGANIVAFLDMIAWSEIGPPLLAVSDNGYNVLVGSTASHPLLFDSYSSPPNILNPETNSTACGRYQTLHKYAVAYIQSLKLPDFSPHSQDLIAVQLLKECKAIGNIESGDLKAAIVQCSSRWASLPGANGYGQHENSFTNLQAAYVAAGGSLKEAT